METKTIGSFIAALRKANGLTQKQLADKLCVSDKAVSRWERDECAPDLSAIPVLAEIFGVTCDELLRGQRVTREPTPAQSANRDKQLNRLLSASRTRFRTGCIVSAGVAAAGLLTGMICNFAFLRGYLGFWLGAVFLVAAAIVLAISAIRGLSSLDTDEFPMDSILNTRLAFFDDARLTLIALLVALAGLIPLLFTGDAYYGLTFGSWIISTAILVLIALLASHFVISALYASLSGKELLPKVDTRAALSRHRSRYVLFMAAFLLLAFIAHILLHSFLPEALYQGTSFDNWDDFKAFMETPTSYDSWDGNWFESTHVETVLPDDGIPTQDYRTETVTAEDGSVLCEYVVRNENVSSITFNFDSSDDGLPVTVFTYSERARSRLVLENVVDPIFIIVYFATPFVFYILCRRKAPRG